jgi:hypothetical protein
MKIIAKYFFLAEVLFFGSCLRLDTYIYLWQTYFICRAILD